MSLDFAGGFNVVHTVHLVAKGGTLEVDPAGLALPRLRADRCPIDSASSPPPQEPSAGRVPHRFYVLRVGERELAAQLDRQPELDVLVDEPVRLDLA